MKLWMRKDQLRALGADAGAQDAVIGRVETGDPGRLDRPSRCRGSDGRRSGAGSGRYDRARGGDRSPAARPWRGWRCIRASPPARAVTAAAPISMAMCLSSKAGAMPRSHILRHCVGGMVAQQAGCPARCLRRSRRRSPVERIPARAEGGEALGELATAERVLEAPGRVCVAAQRPLEQADGLGARCRRWSAGHGERRCRRLLRGRISARPILLRLRRGEPIAGEQHERGHAPPHLCLPAARDVFLRIAARPSRAGVVRELGAVAGDADIGGEDQGHRARRNSRHRSRRSPAWATRRSPRSPRASPREAACGGAGIRLELLELPAGRASAPGGEDPDHVRNGGSRRGRPRPPCAAPAAAMSLPGWRSGRVLGFPRDAPGAIVATGPSRLIWIMERPPAAARSGGPLSRVRARARVAGMARGRGLSPGT